MQGYVVISALTLAASVVNGQNEGCGLAVLDKCYRGFPLNGSTPDILVETVGEIPSVEECQWFCKELYSGECTWFAFDSQTNQCNIFKGSITDYTSSCELVGYPKEPNVADCSTTLTGDDACYNFREGYCRFEDYVILENLQFVQSLEHCQEACRHRPDCKFFLYEEKDKVCHLEGSQKRNCDVVHGLPNPPFGDCLSANKIPFTVHASLNATAAISTATSGATKIDRVIYYEESDTGHGDILESTFTVVPNQAYWLTIEMLQKRVTAFVVDGENYGNCNKRRGNGRPAAVDCELWDCGIGMQKNGGSMTNRVVNSSTGSVDISIAYTDSDTPKQCYCNQTSWECSSNSNGGTEMEAVARISIEPLVEAQYVGCFKSDEIKSNGKMYGDELEDWKGGHGYRYRFDKLQNCAQMAKELGNRYFAQHDNGACLMGSANGGAEYDSYGGAANTSPCSGRWCDSNGQCGGGSGSNGNNAIYEITG